MDTSAGQANALKSVERIMNSRIFVQQTARDGKYDTQINIYIYVCAKFRGAASMPLNGNNYNPERNAIDRFRHLTDMFAIEIYLR